MKYALWLLGVLIFSMVMNYREKKREEKRENERKKHRNPFT